MVEGPGERLKRETAARSLKEVKGVLRALSIYPGQWRTVVGF